MEKRNFVTSRRSPDESITEGMIASAAEKFGGKDSSHLRTKAAEDLTKKASAEDEKSDLAE